MKISILYVDSLKKEERSDNANHFHFSKERGGCLLPIENLCFVDYFELETFLSKNKPPVKTGGK
jgi:hypothetical protein